MFDLSLITNVYLAGESVFTIFVRFFSVIVKPGPTVPVSWIVACDLAPPDAASAKAQAWKATGGDERAHSRSSWSTFDPQVPSGQVR